MATASHLGDRRREFPCDDETAIPAMRDFQFSKRHNWFSFPARADKRVSTVVVKSQAELVPSGLWKRSA